jgi:hypothetical protein
MTNTKKRKKLVAKKRRTLASAVEAMGHHAYELRMAASARHEPSRESTALAAP